MLGLPEEMLLGLNDGLTTGYEQCQSIGDKLGSTQGSTVGTMEKLEKVPKTDKGFSHVDLVVT